MFIGKLDKDGGTQKNNFFLKYSLILKERSTENVQALRTGMLLVFSNLAVAVKIIVIKSNFFGTKLG